MPLSRCGAALTALSATGVVVLGPDARDLVHDVSGPSFPDALLAAGCLVQLSLSLWILGAVALAVLGGSSRLTRALTPRLLRRALFAGAAGALAVGPAHAERAVAPDLQAEHVVSGLRLPDRPTAAPASVVMSAEDVDTRAPDPAPSSIVVRPGDTLWSIAARALPADASDARIARECARWHAANRTVIGADPDLILPSQQLKSPTTKDQP